MKQQRARILPWLKRNILATEIPYAVGLALETARWDYTYKMYRRKYSIDPSFRLEGPGIILTGDGDIILGKNGYLGIYSIVECGRDSVVKIGNRCKLAPFVSIRGSTRDLVVHEIERYGNVIIGDDVWIGTNVYINPNIQIGDRAVIGANSVVTKDVPPDVLACGCPAMVKKRIVP